MTAKQKKPISKISRQYHQAMDELCAARASYVQGLEETKSIVENSLEPYIENTLDLFDRVATDGTGGRTEHTDEISLSRPYKASERAIYKLSKSVDQRISVAEAELFSSEVPYRAKALRMFTAITPANIRAMQELTDKYRGMKIEVSEELRKTLLLLDKNGEKLPVSYAEYSERSAGYDETFRKTPGMTSEGARTLTAQTYPRILQFIS